uniref:Uncharacterized protein n=1 Tax=Oryza brachyantha TaxID=4533 RepID=J3N0N1_ORYBR
MSIVVSKSPSEVVRPSEPVKMDTRKINLSSFDKPLVIAPTVVLQVFEHPIHDPVETIRRALSQALVHYYPIAGRFAVDDDDDVHIDCTGEGVTFVAASANCTILELMRDIDDRAPDAATTVLRKLVVDYPAMGFGRGDPFVLMQVTAFSCGGFVVGVTWNHGVADGFGIAQFLQAVGELARGLPTPLIVPVRSDKVTQAISPSFVESAKQFMFGVTVPSKLALHNITISSKLINSIRGPSCTVFEAVAAALWRCRTRVVMSDPEAPTVLAFTVNSRKYMGVKAGYYGNCATVHVATAKSGEVAQGGGGAPRRHHGRGEDDKACQAAALKSRLRALGSMPIYDYFFWCLLKHGADLDYFRLHRRLEKSLSLMSSSSNVFSTIKDMDEALVSTEVSRAATPEKEAIDEASAPSIKEAAHCALTTRGGAHLA